MKKYKVKGEKYILIFTTIIISPVLIPMITDFNIVFTNPIFSFITVIAPFSYALKAYFFDYYTIVDTDIIYRLKFKDRKLDLREVKEILSMDSYFKLDENKEDKREMTGFIFIDNDDYESHFNPVDKREFIDDVLKVNPSIKLSS